MEGLISKPWGISSQRQRQANIVPVLRVPALEEHFLSRPLDLGACALMIPHIQTRDQVQRVIQATKFRPLGERGLAPLRAHTGFAKVNVPQFIKEANENTMIVIMIEDDEAIHRIEELISVEGVDVAFMGTTDLSYNLGIPGEVRHPEMLKRIDRVIQACEKHNVAFGMPISNPDWYQKGIRFLFAASDIDLIVNGGSEGRQRFQGRGGPLSVQEGWRRIRISNSFFLCYTLCT